MTSGETGANENVKAKVMVNFPSAMKKNRKHGETKLMRDTFKISSEKCSQFNRVCFLENIF